MKIKNNQADINSQNLSYQKINNNILNISNSHNKLNITSDINLNNKIKCFNSQQRNDNLSKDLENKNIKIVKLKKEILKIKNDYQKIININIKYKNELNKAKNMINNYKKKEDQYKKANELMNEITKKEIEFNKKMNYLEDKEKLIEKENLVIENKKREFQKDIENNRKLKEENNDLTKKKNELENQIKEKEKQLNNLNNKILQNQNETNQNYQNINNKSNSQNDNDTFFSKSIGSSTLIKNIENYRKNKQMNTKYTEINNNIFGMDNNNIEINNNNFEKNNNIEMSNINIEMNNNIIFEINNNIGMKANFGMNNNIEINNNKGKNKEFGINNNNLGMYINLGMDNIKRMNNNLEINNDFRMNNNNFVNNNNNRINNNFEINNNNLLKNNNIGMNSNIRMNNNNVMGINNKIQNKNVNIIHLNPKRIISKNEQKQKVKIESMPIKNYSKPPLIGLNNIGSKYLINAILQCLSQTESLTNYFLKQSNKKDIFNNNIANQNNNALQICPVYYELILNLWSKSGIKSYSPRLLIDLIDNINKDNLLKYRAGEPDAKDYIIFLLKQLHKELKKNLKTKNSSIKDTTLNQYDKDNVFKHLKLEESVSIISDIFFGVNETNTICLNCKKIYNSNGITDPICYNYEIFNLLIFPLEEVKKTKNEKMKLYNININQNNIVNIYECFAYNEKDVFFKGDNKNYCNLCKQFSEAIYKTKIFISPNILILILNRGKGNIFNVKLVFNEFIDITQFVLKKDIPKITYNLYAVITHIGEKGPLAHFVAECKNPVDNKWYRYNDDIVSPIQNFQKEVIDYGTPYVLFYKKNNNNIQNNEIK